jgi:hypothetical protein
MGYELYYWPSIQGNDCVLDSGSVHAIIDARLPGADDGRRPCRGLGIWPHLSRALLQVVKASTTVSH